MALQMGSKVEVADNSGASKVNVIKVLGGSGKFIAEVGDILYVSVRGVRAKVNAKVRKGAKYYAIVVRTKQRERRPDGTTIRFDSNAVVLLNNNYEPIGTRVISSISRSIKKVSPRIFSLLSAGVEVA